MENVKKQMVTGGGVQRRRGAAASPRGNRPTAAATKPKASFSGKPGTFNPFGKSEDGMSCINCPNCGEGISKAYAVKALVMLAKSEGIELNEELEALAADGLYEEEVNQEHADKAVSGATNYVGNKVASHKGKAPGKGQLVGKYRAGGKKGVDRAGKPTNPVTEQGMKKSLSLPVIVGDAQLVDYGFGDDSFVAKGIEEGSHHLPPARNLRAEQEIGSGEATPE